MATVPQCFHSLRDRFPVAASDNVGGIDQTGRIDGDLLKEKNVRIGHGVEV